MTDPALKTPRQLEIDAYNVALRSIADSLDLIDDPALDAFYTHLFDGQSAFQIHVMGDIDSAKESGFQGLRLNMVDADLTPFSVAFEFGDGSFRIGGTTGHDLTLAEQHMIFITSAERMARKLLTDISIQSMDGSETKF